VKHWHRCKRWTDRKLRCPYSGGIHDELKDDDDDDEDTAEDEFTFPEVVKVPVPGKRKEEAKVTLEEQVVKILEEAEAWNQEPIGQEPIPAPPPPLVPPGKKMPEPTIPTAPVPVQKPFPKFFPEPALAPVIEGAYKAGAPAFKPAMALAPLMQQAMEGLYKAGASTSLSPASLAKGLYQAPTPVSPTFYPPLYYGKGPDVALKPVLASVEKALAQAVATYKPIEQPSPLSTFIENVKPYVKPAVVGATAAGAAGAGGFFFNWAARLKSMSGGF
jgi:hypothetical protein